MTIPKQQSAPAAEEHTTRTEVTIGATRWSDIEADLLTLPRSRRRGRGPSALQILNGQRKEAHHEQYLKFLLAPREVHGLGTGMLSALLSLAGLTELAANPRLARAHVHQQVRGATSRPDLIVTSPAASVVIELKVDAPEGNKQTTRQGDDFADLPDPVFVYLTAAGEPARDKRFRPVALRDLAGQLARLLAMPMAGPAAVGRRHAENYLDDLETTVGISTDDDDDARFWITHSTALLAAQDAARRLLKLLPAHMTTALTALAAEIGEDLTVATVPYIAKGNEASYPETAVIMSRPQWLTGDTPVLGFGLGIRRETDQHCGPDPDDNYLRPFYGIYCTDPAVSADINRRFIHKGWGGHWAWWQYVNLTAQPHGIGFLEHNAAAATRAIRDAWLDRSGTVESVWAGHRNR
ncbi:hypothetical protein ABTY61_22940 [Kitasatospora sp. NPDC096128]|uniref:hypothetical protein n=1 Tax=Kitasatospora sp. NPDC096128 TaxID=3155547 RepID=UPI003323FFF7